MGTIIQVLKNKINSTFEGLKFTILHLKIIILKTIFDLVNRFIILLAFVEIICSKALKTICTKNILF